MGFFGGELLLLFCYDTRSNAILGHEIPRLQSFGNAELKHPLRNPGSAMSTSRPSDRASLARQHHPQSPFARAREPNYDFDLETSNFPTPSKQDGSRSRHYRTSTLAGAYRAASRASMEESFQLTSPRRMQEPFSKRSPPSESNPPDDYRNIYQRSYRDKTVGDYEPSDRGDVPNGARSSSRASHTSSRLRDQDYHQQYRDGLALSDGAAFDATSSLSPRRRTSDYTKDEQRLRRVTGKDSPVFSKAKVGARVSLTADNLQRREYEEDRQMSLVSEDEGEFGPSLNLPSVWGSRAKRNPNQWIRKSSQNSFSDSQEGVEQPVNSIDNYQSTLKTEASPVPISLRSPRRSGLPARTALGESSANVPMSDGHDLHQPYGKSPVLDQNERPGGGDPIPNTPVIVYKTSAFPKSEADKREPLQFLRSLSKAESPVAEQVQTPEQPKLFERKIYDKTPRVTGAWIDTPMTERVADRVTELPNDLTRDIVPLPSSEKTDGPAQHASLSEQIQSKIDETHEKATTNDSPKEQKMPEQTKSSIAQRPRPVVSRPKLPKSALETVIEDVNSGKEKLDFPMGDDTLESLQAIIDDPTEPKTEEEEVAYEKELLKKLELAHAKAHGSVELDQMNDKLTSLARHINDVKYGLNNLEGHFTQGAKLPSQLNPGVKEGPSNTQSAALHGNVVQWDELPRLWARDPLSGRLQFTTLGKITLVTLVWYVIECIMNEQYCQPIYTSNRGSYCLQTDAPEFPLVTLTMLWRWSHLSALIAPIATVSVALFRFVAQLLGLSDGFVNEPPQLGRLVGEIRINGTPVQFPWLASPTAHTTAESIVPQQPQQTVWTAHRDKPVTWDEDQPSMDDDEYL